MSGFKQIFMRSVKQLTGRPIYWVAMFVLPFYGLWLIAVGLGANGSLAAGVIIVGSLLIGGIVAAKNQ